MISVQDIGILERHPISPLYSAGWNDARSCFIKLLESAGITVISGEKIVTEQTSKYFQQLKSALELQDSLNKVVDENWVELNREWYRAIWIECAEMMDHVGWKWWKKKTPNTEQAQLELVDIFHFGLSDLIVKKGMDESIINKLALAIENAELIYIEDRKVQDPLLDLEQYTNQILSTKSFDMFNFAYLCQCFSLTFESLYKQYVGKNVLNKFRQDMGYKEGTYIKSWDGKDDNEHLVEIVKYLEFQDIHFADNLYSKLRQSYILGNNQ